MLGLTDNRVAAPCALTFAFRGAPPFPRPLRAGLGCIGAMASVDGYFTSNMSVTMPVVVRRPTPTATTRLRRLYFSEPVSNTGEVRK